MEIEVHSLASGSSGNAMLVRAGDRFLLIDAGLGPRMLLPLLKKHGVRAGALAAILLTHEHDDHLCGLQPVSARLGAPVVANRATLDAASRRAEPPHVTELSTGGEIALGPFVVRSFPVSHDAVEPVGYVVQADGKCISYATDAGHPTQALRESMRGAHLCVIEANHDVEWLRRGPYPPFMKARVAGERGHLSNLDAVNLIAERLDQDGPATFWLAHLSAVNNSPSLARRFALEGLRERTSVQACLEIALRDRPSATWRPGTRAAQLTLF